MRRLGDVFCCLPPVEILGLHIWRTRREKEDKETPSSQNSQSSPNSRLRRWSSFDSDEAESDEPSFVPSSPSRVQQEVDAILQAEVVSTWDSSGFQSIRTVVEARRNFGYVYLMKRSTDDGCCFAAVKRMPRTWMTGSAVEFDKKHRYDPERPWADVGILRYLSDKSFPYMCDLLGVFEDATNMYVATCWADGGDLCSWSSEFSSGPEREAELRPLIKQLFNAVRHLHNLGIAHRDLSLENVVLCSQAGDIPSVKLIDFAMATADPWNCNDICGKRAFRAPEMYWNRDYNALLADVFALGVILYVLAVGEYPWESTRRGSCTLYDSMLRRGLKTSMESSPECRAISQACLEVIEGLLIRHPKDRYTLGEDCWSQCERPRPAIWQKKWLEH